MPIRITLSDNEIVEVDLELQAWNRAYQKAVQGDTMLEIEEPDGSILSINPHRILLVEALSPARAGQSAIAAS